MTFDYLKPPQPIGIFTTALIVNLAAGVILVLIVAVLLAGEMYKQLQ